MVALRFVALGGIVPFTTRMMADVATEAFHRVQRLSTDWHANSFAGSVQRKVTRGMWALDTLNDTLLLALLPSLTILLGSMLLLTARAPVLGLVMAVGAVAYVTLTITLATRWIAPASRLSNQWDTRIGGVLADAIGSNAVVKAFAGEAREDALLGAVMDKWRRRVTRTWNRHVVSSMGLLALLWAVRIAITGTALWLWSRGQASAGDVAYVITAYLVVHGYLRDIGEHVHQLQRGINELEELVELDSEPLGIADRAGAVPIVVEAGAIAFEDVTFTYPDAAHITLDSLSFVIEPQATVALVGPSGAGKSTVFNLLTRLYDPQAGRITIDGVDSRDMDVKVLRHLFGVIPQEPDIFATSLTDNIAFALPHADHRAVEKAAKMANATEFIERLPKG